MVRAHYLAPLIRFAVLATLVGMLPTVAMACLHKYKEEQQDEASKRAAAERQHGDQYISGLLPSQGNVPSPDTLEQSRLAAENGDFRARSDYAVALVRHGELPQAIEILKAVDEQRPGEYIVAANLGTAFELAGDDRQALEWITTGLHRDPHSQTSTEWLHEKISKPSLPWPKSRTG
ncbi:MAG TPA: hypothetical protein VGG30_03165 [Pirellulales bacterium]|jgi:predicted Zn-dependent protease